MSGFRSFRSIVRRYNGKIDTRPRLHRRIVSIISSLYWLELRDIARCSVTVVRYMYNNVMPLTPHAGPLNTTYCATSRPVPLAVPITSFVAPEWVCTSFWGGCTAQRCQLLNIEATRALSLIKPGYWGTTMRRGDVADERALTIRHTNLAFTKLIGIT